MSVRTPPTSNGGSTAGGAAAAAGAGGPPSSPGGGGGGGGSGDKNTTILALDKRALWTHKHIKNQRYASEHNKEPAWFRHSKHVLVFSWAGRPIYTRYGDESKLAAYMGVCSAIISNVQRANDNVRSLVAGDHTFVFALRGPIYLVAISRTGESVRQLRAQLDYTHQQIISVLTGSVHQVLESRPQYDIRNLLGPTTELLLTDLISDFRNPAFLLDAVNVLRLPAKTRTKVHNVLRKQRSKNLLFSILLAGQSLAACVRIKDKVIAASDLLLLINFVTNSQSLRSAEAWTPVCLPKFSDKGWVYAYVCFIADDVCLVLLTADAEDFYALRECGRRIVDALNEKSPAEPLPTAAAKDKLASLGPGPAVSVLDDLTKAMADSGMGVNILPVPAAPLGSGAAAAAGASASTAAAPISASGASAAAGARAGAGAAAPTGAATDTLGAAAAAASGSSSNGDGSSGSSDKAVGFVGVGAQQPQPQPASVPYTPHINISLNMSGWGGFSVDEMETGVHELRHVLYKSDAASQFVCSAPAVPYIGKRAQTAIIRRYQHIHARISENRKRHSLYYEVTSAACHIGLVKSGDFELYATFTPLVSREAVMSACNKAIKWLKREDATLFIAPIPNF